MGKTSIEWTDASWNPIVGCTEISPGCANCYAARLASTRLRETPQYRGLAGNLKSEIQFPGVAPHGIPEGKIQPRWTGEVRFLQERLEEPLHWRAPRRIFVCDMGDLFHESVPVSRVAQVMGVIERCPHHTFQILTKRANLMHAFFFGLKPLPNVWLGVSVENQHFADERIPLLLNTPAAVRWISAEPLLGLTHVRQWMMPPELGPRIDWVVCGGESGPNARPMHPAWAARLCDECVMAKVPFFFKQWGEWLHATQMEAAFTPTELDTLSRNTLCRDTGHGDLYFKVGKKRAGRQLDGSDWNQFPQVRA